MKDKEKALQMLRDNIPIDEIAEATGYSRGYLNSLTKLCGIVRTKITIENYKEQIFYMVEQGKTPAEIGQAIGYSEITVHNCINTWKREEKYMDEPEVIKDYYPEEILTLVERKPIQCPTVEYEGKRWRDVTEVYCPR